MTTDGPVQAGLVPSYVVDDEKGGPPVLGLEGGPVPEVSRTGPDPSEGEVCQSIDIHTANINLGHHHHNRLSPASRLLSQPIHPLAWPHFTTTFRLTLISHPLYLARAQL